MKHRLHVCFAYLSYPSATGGSGVANQARALGNALTERGIQVSIIALRGRGDGEVEHDGDITVHRIMRGNLHWYVSRIPVIGVALAPAAREFEDSWRLRRCIAALHRTNPIDVLGGTETACIFLPPSGTGIPLVIRLHGERYTLERRISVRDRSPGIRLARVVQRRVLRRASLLVSPSETHAREISTELRGSHPPIRVIPNVVTFPPAEPTTTGSSEFREGPTFLYAGRLERGKGILTLLQAMELVLSHIPNARLIVAGEGHPSLPAGEIRRALREGNLDDRVDIRGPVGVAELARLYARASVCVVPSYYESFGLAAVEPMLFDVPVVASRVGGLIDILEDRVTALLVPPGDTEALATAMVRCVTDHALRESMVRNAGEMVRTRYGPESIMPLNVEMYQSLALRSDAYRPGIHHVFISPHPDDVAWSCGGLVAGLVRRRQEVSVITVFGRQSGIGDGPAFARHLAAKWGMRDGGMRRREDEVAMGELGVDRWESWDFAEAPSRRAPDGEPLYAAYEELMGEIAAPDIALIETLQERIYEAHQGDLSSLRLYVPMAIGNHVDHQLLHLAGVELARKGIDVRFYEDWPYAESAVAEPHPGIWQEEMVAVDLEAKVRAAVRYHSQLGGVGGSESAVERRLRSWSVPRGGRAARERFWRLRPVTGHEAPAPFVRPDSSHTAGFDGFLNTLRWHDLDEVLPPGSGTCVDVGCGNGRHREPVERAGYRWVGIDMERNAPGEPFVQGDAQALPLDDGSAAAVVLWQVLEYVEDPARAVAEAARVLETGGVLCGSASFLEPVHGKTRFGLGPMAIEEMLHSAGLGDIQLSPGLNGFSLMTWTLLRRGFGERAARLALGLTAMWLLPLMGMRYWTSRLWARFGRGSDHGSDWVGSGFPLEFAGHIQFCARKRAKP